MQIKEIFDIKGVFLQLMMWVLVDIIYKQISFIFCPANKGLQTSKFNKVSLLFPCENKKSNTTILLYKERDPQTNKHYLEVQ